MIVDNRVGAAGTIAAGIAARAEADGHTLFMASSTFVVSPFFIKGVTDAVVGVTRGEIAVYFQNMAAAMPYVKSGRIKPLAISTAKRNVALPDVPAMAETLPGFDISSFYGIIVPAKTPKPVIAKLNAEVNAIIALPEMRARLAALGSEIVGGEPAALSKRMRDEREQVTRVVKRIETRDAASGRKS